MVPCVFLSPLPCPIPSRQNNLGGETAASLKGSISIQLLMDFCPGKLEEIELAGNATLKTRAARVCTYVRGWVFLYSPSFRDGSFPETGLPLNTILGNSNLLRG
jgi:hypothetical protein